MYYLSVVWRLNLSVDGELGELRDGEGLGVAALDVAQDLNEAHERAGGELLDAGIAAEEELDEARGACTPRSGSPAPSRREDDHQLVEFVAVQRSIAMGPVLAAGWGKSYSLKTFEISMRSMSAGQRGSGE